MKNPTKKNAELSLADKKEALVHLKEKKNLVPFEKASFDLGRQAAVEYLKSPVDENQPEAIKADEILAQLYELIERGELKVAGANKIYQALLQKAQSEIFSMK
jgi:hypothetical protein